MRLNKLEAKLIAAGDVSVSHKGHTIYTGFKKKEIDDIINKKIDRLSDDFFGEV